MSAGESGRTRETSTPPSTWSTSPPAPCATSPRMQRPPSAAGTRLLTFTIEAEVRFAEPGDVHRFTDALPTPSRQTAAVRHTAGRPYRVVAGGHPPARPRRTAHERAVAVGSPSPRRSTTVWTRCATRRRSATGTAGSTTRTAVSTLRSTSSSGRASSGGRGGGDDHDRRRLAVRGSRRATPAAPSCASPWPRRPPAPSWDAFYDDIREGWTTFVHQLHFALEQHPGAERRTLQLDGAGERPARPATLGLPDPPIRVRATRSRPRGARRGPAASCSMARTRSA